MHTGQHGKHRDMTTGSITKNLLLFAVPLMLGDILQQLYSTADSMIVGRVLGTEALAAVGSTTMIINLMLGLFIGFSMGATVTISAAYGAKDEEEVRRSVHTVVLMTVIIGGLLSLIGFIITPTMLRLMKTPEDVFPQAVVYLRVYFLGMLSSMAYNMLSGILRSVGDSFHPLLYLAVSSLSNIVLDMLFVWALPWGVAGAALATILSQTISALLALNTLSRSEECYGFKPKHLCLDRRIAGRILLLGFPISIQRSVTALSNTFVQAYINAFGSSCMAGWSVYFRLHHFTIAPLQSLSNAVTTFAGQNRGARQWDRIGQGTRVGTVIAFVFTLVVSAATTLLARPLTLLFVTEETAVSFGVLFVQILFPFSVIQVFHQIMAGTLRGYGDTTGPTVILLGCLVGLRQLYLFILNLFVQDVALTALSFPVGWGMCMIFMTVYYFIYKKRFMKKVAAEDALRLQEAL